MRRAGGSVLILSVWATAALTGLGLMQAQRISLQVRWIDRVQSVRQSWYLAYSGAAAAAAQIQMDADTRFDAPSEAWWRQMPRKPVLSGPGRFRYELFDEQARIPLNAAPLEVLSALPGVEMPVAAELVSRRNDPLNPRPVLHLAELADFGLETEELEALEPLVTVQEAPSVNLNSASAEVLELLGFSSNGVELFLRYRAGLDGEPGTEDDGVFRGTTQIPENMAEAGMMLSQQDLSKLKKWVSSGLLGVASSFFRIEAEGVAERYGTVKKIYAVIQRGKKSGSTNIQAWREA